MTESTGADASDTGTSAEADLLSWDFIQAPYLTYREMRAGTGPRRLVTKICHQDIEHGPACVAGHRMRRCMCVGYRPKVLLEYQGHFIEHDGVGCAIRRGISDLTDPAFHLPATPRAVRAGR